ncbi:MAG: hypothetical protein ACRDTG_27430 [Pseudonocardiaceae bacterium]
MRRHGMPSASSGWVRVVALLAVIAMVAPLGYSALVSVQTPTWLVIVVVALLVGVPLGLLARGQDRS